MSTEGADSTPEIGSEDWWEAHLRQREAAKAQSAQRLKDACPALASLGVTNIIWAYDGEGDSGSMQDITVTGSGTAPKTIDALKELLKGFDPETCEKLNWDKLKDAVWDLIPDGFENNDGGYGEVELKTTTGSIQVRHNQRITDVEYEEDNY